MNIAKLFVQVELSRKTIFIMRFREKHLACFNFPKALLTMSSIYIVENRQS